MKKFAIILLAIALIVASIAITACEVNPDTCKHKWGEWVESKAATCTADGEKTRTCTICNTIDTQPIDALGGLHQILNEDGSLTLCRKVDFAAGAECSLCGALLTGEDLISAVDHKSYNLIQGHDATCTETGLTDGKQCKSCNNIIEKQQVIEALGHDEVDAVATQATCTDPEYTAGTQCSRCGEFLSGHEAIGEALGHDFSHGGYFTIVLCANNCGMYGSLTGGDPFETEFVFDFDESKQEEIDILYETIKSALEGTNSEVDFDTFIELFEEYDDAVGYVQAQYQFAKILNDIEYTDESRDTMANMSEYYNTTVSRYYTLFKDVDQSKFGSDFWTYTEWDDDYIEYVLGLADSYDLDNRNIVDDIIEQYEDLLATIMGAPSQSQRLELFNLYAQLVVANNNIATTAGYNNYMEYAYDKVYERDYSPSDVVTMREYVKEYIGPIVADVAEAYNTWNNNYINRGGWKSRQSQLYYSQYVGNWMWGAPNKYLNDAERLGMILDSRKSIADYFTFLSDGDDLVDFFGAVENLFATGNFFMGVNTNITAYTWYIYSKDTPILVFGGDSEYQDAFTFIHEFGHYYQFVHNGTLSVPMDHDETQSQGNEMLFLAWLREHMPEGVYEGFEIMELEHLINTLGSIILSTAVDEFEYLVYTGATTFDGEPIATVQLADGTEVIDYATLYKVILESYWKDVGELFNTSYWMYVTFDSAAYYISYAMSALPCIELYAKAGNEGLEAARASYLKLFTFSSDDSFVAEDSFGDLYVTKTYQEVLNWAGLSGPFQQSLYETIVEYFATR